MLVSNGWTLPVITVNCGSYGGDTSAIPAELDENNAFDTTLASRVSNVEANLLQETKERKADVSSLISGLQSEETAPKADVGSLTSSVTNVETKNTSQDISIAGLNASISNTSVTLLNRIGAVETKEHLTR
jgi:hypothetical protein